jgi:hypothetical protein
MAVAIRNLVPYEIAIHAVDIGSGKPITNILYYKNKVQTVAPPAYGAPIAGGSDVATLLNNVLTVWDLNIVPLLNANYQMQNGVARAIIGKRYGTPLIGITGLVVGANTQLTTGVAHGFTTGQQVSVAGITTPSGLNQNWTITVIDSTNFTLNGAGSSGSWSGDGTVQRVRGPLQFTYADQVAQTDSEVGGVVDDALPLFVSASVRRISSGVGRNFRSRLSISPMSEGDSLDGGWVAGTKTAWATALGVVAAATPENGGSDATSKFSDPIVLSKSIAVTLPSPFTLSSPYTSVINSMILQRNAGSIVRRKPRLTNVIT